MDIYFILCVIIIQYYFSFCATFSTFQVMLGALSVNSYVPVGFCLFVSLFGAGTTQCYRFILYTSCPNPSLSCFSEEPWFLLLENGMRNQDLCVNCARYYWCIAASWPSWLTGQENILCILMSMYTSVCEYFHR